MDYYAGLDISLRSCALCIVDGNGTVLLERELPCEVSEIAACLGAFPNPIERVGFEAGTMSYSEISGTDEGPYVLTDFTSSGMTHSEPAYAELNNAKRIKGPFTGFNFGEVSISWNDPAGPIVTLRCYDAVGRQQFEHNIQASELHLD
ncbi:hypothetical protein [Sulfitobacter sp. SK012]|uniref:hypothetical protein n=1 Tax=Sulfitobacter sp. SK012 TaxID=1389005 RepID=UPI0020C7E0E2|nr:hypothetical protein [Sulfitobacter sp. SK012]